MLREYKNNFNLIKNSFFENVMITLFLILFKSAFSLTSIEIFYDSFCDKCPFMLGMNLHDLIKIPHSLEDLDINLIPFA